MPKKNINPIIDWKIIHGKSFLYFKFNDILTLEDAEQGIEKWDACFEDPKYAKTKITLIWDCLLMNNYETKARLAWQKNIKKQKHKIDSIWLVTGSVNVTAGAEILSFFTSFKIRTVKSFEILESKLSSIL